MYRHFSLFLALLFSSLVAMSATDYEFESSMIKIDGKPRKDRSVVTFRCDDMGGWWFSLHSGGFAYTGDRDNPMLPLSMIYADGTGRDRKVVAESRDGVFFLSLEADRAFIREKCTYELPAQSLSADFADRFSELAETLQEQGHTSATAISSLQSDAPTTPPSEQALRNASVTESFESKAFSGLIEKDVVRDGEKGILIRTRFMVAGPRKDPCFLIANFRDVYYQEIRCRIEPYSSPKGNLWTYDAISLPYANNAFDNCELFLPYRVMPRGVCTLRLFLTVQSPQGDETQSGYITFSINGER